MRAGQKFLRFYFGFFILLTLAAQVPVTAILLFFIIPVVGFFLGVGAATILLYSFALLPAWFALTEKKARWILAFASLAIPAAIAVLPGTVSRKNAETFERQWQQGDFAKSTEIRPKFIEVVGDQESLVFQYGQTVGDSGVECSEICRRLLFSGNVERVRMTKTPYGTTYRRMVGKSRSVTYRLEKRDECPSVSPPGVNVEKNFTARLLSGDCLIRDADDALVPDAVVSLLTIKQWQTNPLTPDEAPRHVEFDIMRRLRIEIPSKDRPPLVLVQRTEMTLKTIVLPFYFSYELHMQGGGYNGQTLGREPRTTGKIDLAEAIGAAFGFEVPPVAPPEDTTRLGEKILSLNPATHPFFSDQEQNIINDIMIALKARPSLSEQEVAFIGKVVTDKRFNKPQLGGAISNIIRANPAGTEALLPFIFARMTARETGLGWSYQSMLGQAAANFPASVLAKYQDDILAALRDFQDTTPGGLFTRAGELGVDTSTLIISRLGSENQSVSNYAGVAACRASDDVWEKLEPYALSRLEASVDETRLRSGTVKLMGGLVRHGKKQVVSDFLDRSRDVNKEGIRGRLKNLENDPAIDECNKLY